MSDFLVRRDDCASAASKAGANKSKWKPSRKLRVGGYRLAATPEKGKTKRAGFALLNPKRS